MRLLIESKHDIIAFAGLAICGLTAAAIGSRRGERVAALEAARRELDLLHGALEAALDSGTTGTRVEPILRAAREALPLAGAVVRDVSGSIVAVTSPAYAAHPEPATIFDGDTLHSPGATARSLPEPGAAFPVAGARLALRAGGRQVGWLDVWGDGRDAGLRPRRTLTHVAVVLALVLQG